MTMLYPKDKSIKELIERIKWDTQKSIEAVGKWAQKKEEQERKIKRNNLGCLIYPKSDP